ncbi:MAG: protein kinase [Acetatifactor sp.]|nr:protein kinase [Acetatifactor sp.]
MKRCLNCMKEYEEGNSICPHCGYVEGTKPKEIYYLKPGTILHDQYIIGTTVDAGGFGIVYRAWDTALARMIAIKEFFPMGYVNRIPGHKEIMVFANKKQEFKKEVQRFLEEAKYLARFSNHPNIINVYSFFEENNTAYIAMEFLEGISYKEFIKSQGGKIDIDSSVSVIVAVLEALKEIHKENIIHRDVAPDNIYICWDGRIKLMDFGAARFSKKEEDLDAVLKPGFAPPEQYQPNSRQGTFTDIYAVGAVLYRSLTGKMPIEASDRLEQDDLKAPNEINPEIPEKLNNIILRAMAIQPDLRFQTDEEFIEVLNENYNGKIRSIKEELKHRKQIRLIKSSIAIFILCIGLGIGFFVYDAKKSEIELKPASLEVWIQEKNASVNEANFLSALAEFTEKYPQIQVVVKVIPKNQYEAKLKEAATNHTLPDVYEPIEGIELATKDLSRLAKYVDASEYSGLDLLNAKNVEEMPITFKIPVVYVSKVVEGYSEDAAKSEYESSLINGTFQSNEEKVIAFLKGESPFVVADTSYYWVVQEQQGGKYEMKPVPGVDTCKAEYSLAFSVDKATSRSQYYAAVQMLYYLLGEKAQSKLCIEQHLDLPLQNTIYDRYTQLNMEYQALEEEKNHLRFGE